MEDELLFKVVGPWDHSVKEEDIEQMKVLWEDTFDQPYEKAGGKLAVAFRGAFAVQIPFYWVLSDSDVNIKYKSLHPRFLLEVSHIETHIKLLATCILLVNRRSSEIIESVHGDYACFVSILQILQSFQFYIE